MHMALRIDGALRRHQRLADHLAAENPLPARLRTATTKQIVFQRFQVENGEQVL